jgi:hypothetical protein
MANLTHQGYNKVMNFLNAQKASQIDGAALLQDHLSKTSQLSSNYQVLMMGAQQEGFNSQQSAKIRAA